MTKLIEKLVRFNNKLSYQEILNIIMFHILLLDFVFYACPLFILDIRSHIYLLYL
jgi:hypothetical protein